MLSADQKLLVGGLAKSTSGVFGLAAVAGSGKTIVLTGVLLQKIPTMKLEERMIWLVKSRKGRDEQVDLFRRFLVDPLQVASVGRRRSAGADDSDEDAWDHEIARFVDDRVNHIKTKLERLRAEMLSMPQFIQVGTEQWLVWRQTAEIMHVLSMRLHAETMLAVQEAFAKAKILVMTVGGFTQLVSGFSANDYLIKDKVFVSCAIDEAQQLDFSSVAPIAAVVRHLLLIWDPAQRIEFVRSCNAQGLDATSLPGDFFPWERSIYGGSLTPAWSCLRAADIHYLKYSFRFGHLQCRFLRDTCAGYDPRKSRRLTG